MDRLGSILLAAGLLGGVLWAGRQASLETVDARWAAEHNQELRRVINLRTSVELEFKQARHDPETGYIRVLFEAVEGKTRQALELGVSQDGTQVHFEGRTFELADPFGAMREKISLENVPGRGPADAPVTIVEYSDYTCVYCRQFFLTQEQPLFDRYGSQVRLLYKHFPASQLRPWSEDAHVAAACAYRQGDERFWPYHKRLFQEARRLGEGQTFLLELAREAGLDLAAFRTCLATGQGLLDVARDVEEGQALRLQGTPAFFINGRPVYGLIRADYFFHTVEEELAVAQAR